MASFGKWIRASSLAFMTRTPHVPVIKWIRASSLAFMKQEGDRPGCGLIAMTCRLRLVVSYRTEQNSKYEVAKVRGCTARAYDIRVLSLLGCAD